MKTAREYVQSLGQLHPVVYAFGERIENVVDHPLTRPHVNAAAMTYHLATLPEYKDLMTATSHLTGATINRFTHIHQNTDDLIKKVKMLRLLGQRTGSCFQRCVGLDALNALYSVTYEMDQAFGTEYHKRLVKYLRKVQDEDLMCAGSMTDPKGDRSLSPHEQPDPDMYVHVVERRSDGIVVSGAKAHQTGIVNSHEFICLPTVAMDEEDKDYALAFALPVDAPGVIHVFGRQSNDTRKLEDSLDQGNARFGTVGGEALTILDNVFVPWDRVFMCGEYQFTRDLVERFASYHRQNYGACKVGVADVIVGAAAAIAECNGVNRASHIRDKLVEMCHLSETLYCGSIACSCEGAKTPSGAYVVDSMLANVTKQNVTRLMYEICRLCQDIAGGFIATLPSERDLKNPEIGKYVQKYFRGSVSYTTEYRFRMARLIENLTAGTALVESMHGAGSPQAQRIMIYRQANLAQKKKLAEAIAGITGAPE
ncbi:MAG TPA: 4-hydroxybutyryl-CoA dehydratase [Firmicutes bacterium]|nr:4-hydroxybutyryl-CoA dehydratase [Candidatus Fermentithermobacillaceae bacterium]